MSTTLTANAFGISEVLKQLGIKETNYGASTGLKHIATKGKKIDSYSPVDGQLIGSINAATAEDYKNVMTTAKEALGKLVSYEMGKSLQEGYGEVQEMIDICDFAVGLSRQLYGLTMHSERPLHRMYEQWHPLGIVGIISAFNFPVAVCSWHAALALVCVDICIWKPSEKTPLCGLAVQN